MLRSITTSALLSRKVVSSCLGASRSHSMAAARLGAPRLYAPQPLATIVGRRFYTPMTKEEEEQEKARVTHLIPEEKEQELRAFNRELARLEMLKGINNGELYTWSGRYKALLRNYGLPLFVYYWAVYGTMGVTAYLAIDFGGLDAMAVLGKFDDFTGWSLTEKVDPALGKIGLALVVNELLEPIRLPFVVATLKPVMETVSPPKY
jgi:hypothetical protein